MASGTFPIPVRAIGPGSQPPDPAEDGARLDVLPMPGPLQVFEMPHVPERVDPQVMRASAARLQAMLDAIEAHDCDAAGAGPPCVALDDLPAAVLTVTNQVLGEGEVSIRVAACGGQPALHVQESVFAGLWRCGELHADGSLARYWLEAGPMPAAVTRAATQAGPVEAHTLLADPPQWPAGTMNGQALLAELRARVAAAAGRPGQHGGQINLSLLPLSPADHTLIAQALPPGPVAIISRGFGDCHVGSTAVPGVWRQQYFNSMKTLILDLVEVTAMPEVATASDDDLHDSRERLAELVRWMRESAAYDLAKASADERASH